MLRQVVSWLRRGAWLAPDEPFHNFKALKSVDRRILFSSGTSCDGFLSSKIGKGLVGRRRKKDYVLHRTSMFARLQIAHSLFFSLLERLTRPTLLQL